MGLAGHVDGGEEALGVVGTVVGHLVAGQLVEAPGGQLLQPGLVVLAPGTGRGLGDALAQQAHHQSPRPVPAAVEVDRADDGLHRVGEDRRLLAAARLVLPFAQQHRRPQMQLGRQLGQHPGVDDRGAHLRQLPLGQQGVGAKDVIGDDQPEHGVAEELETFVRVRAGGLRAP